MSFREKIAWVSLAGIVIAFAPYFALLGRYRGSERIFPSYSGGLFAVVTVLIVVVTVIGSVGVALTNRRDAQAPADERDRIIARHAAAIAHAVLMTLLFFALATLFFGFSRGALANAVLAAIVIAELVRCAAQITLYRKGA